MFKLRFIPISALLFLFAKTFAQGPQKPQTPIFDPETIYNYDEVDWKPQFPGGDWQFIRFFKENIILPPASDELRNVSKIWTRFVVETDGSITELEFTQSTVLDERVRELFDKMPKWDAGMHHGRAVRVRYDFPILVHID